MLAALHATSEALARAEAETITEREARRQAEEPGLLQRSTFPTFAKTSDGSAERRRRGVWRSKRPEKRPRPRRRC